MANESVPDQAPVALVLIDVINDMEFVGGEELFRAAFTIADRLRELKRRAKAAGIPTVYVNDNFGRWRSDFRHLVRHCVDDDVRGRPIARLLAPDENDYFVLKPHNSAFHETPLATLLQYLGVRRLIVAGFAGNICVLFTANDAHMRGYEVYVPEDCVASENPHDTEYALRLMRDFLSVNTCRAADLDLAGLIGP